MTEFDRSGHWRTLSDGTRTWVSGHTVAREPGSGRKKLKTDTSPYKRAKEQKKERKRAAKELKHAFKMGLVNEVDLEKGLKDLEEGKKKERKRGKTKQKRRGRHNDHLAVVGKKQKQRG